MKRSSVRIRPWPLRWVLGQGSLLPLSQGEAFTLASISYLAILVKYILAKKKKKESNIHSQFLGKKKSSRKMTMLFWWMKTGKYLCVFCVEALALRNKNEKKEVEGRRDREREDTSKKKKKKGGSEGKFEWFLCTRRKIGERQATVWAFQGGDTLVSSSTHFPSFTRLSDKSSPLPNARHEGTRNVSCRRHCAADCLFMTRRGETLAAGVLIPAWLQ